MRSLATSSFSILLPIRVIVTAVGELWKLERRSLEEASEKYLCHSRVHQIKISMRIQVKRAFHSEGRSVSTLLVGSNAFFCSLTPHSTICSTFHSKSLPLERHQVFRFHHSPNHVHQIEAWGHRDMPLSSNP